MAVFNILKIFIAHSILSPNGIFSQELSRQPPVITSNFNNIYYLPEGIQTNITLLCTASGRPMPRITWLRNGQQINKKGNKSMLHIESKDSDAFGRFQCSANNSHGLSVSPVFEIKKAALPPFDSKRAAITQKVKLHESISLQCYGRPDCYPGCYVEWKRSQGTENSVITNQRISVDKDGTLHLLYALESDGDEPAAYGCGVFNKMLNGFVKSQLSTIIEVLTDDVVENVPLKLLYNKNVTATIGESTTLQCIFSGFPLPTITWSFENKVLDPALNNDIMYDKFKNGTENRRKLIINVLREDHHGTYQCTASQMISGNNISKTVDMYLYVTGPPKISKELQPKIQPESSNVIFTCRAASLPGNSPPEKPVWYKNNEIIDESDTKYIRKSLDGTQLTLLNVTMLSTSSIKCEVSNDYGAIYSETYLTVIEKIRILQQPKRKLKLSLEKVEYISISAVSDPDLELFYTWRFKQIAGTVYTQSSLPIFLQTSGDHSNLTIDIQRLDKRDIIEAIGVLTVNVSHRYSFKTIDINIDLDEELKNRDVIVINKPPKALVITSGARYNIYVNAADNPLSTTRYSWHFQDSNGALYTQANLPKFFQLSIDGKNLTIIGTDLASSTAAEGVLSINISNDFSYRTFNVVITIKDDVYKGNGWSQWSVCNDSTRLEYRSRCNVSSQNCAEERPCRDPLTAEGNDDGNSYIPIIIAVVVILIILGFVAGFLVYRRMKKEKYSLPNNQIDKSVDKDAPSQPERRKEVPPST